MGESLGVVLVSTWAHDLDLIVYAPPELVEICILGSSISCACIIYNQAPVTQVNTSSRTWKYTITLRPIGTNSSKLSSYLAN